MNVDHLKIAIKFRRSIFQYFKDNKIKKVEQLIGLHQARLYCGPGMGAVTVSHLIMAVENAGYRWKQEKCI